MNASDPVSALDRNRLVAWYRMNRDRSRSLFGSVADAGYEARPIPLRHPIVFYDGHLPAFSVNTLAKKGHGLPGVDEALEVLFERGIDPGSTDEAARLTIQAWPSRDEVAAYGRAADALVLSILEEQPLHRDDRPAMRRAEAAWTILEHEAMHHETFLYILHALDRSARTLPFAPSPIEGPRVVPSSVRVPAGVARLGAARDAIPFGWDNEFEEVEIGVEPFDVDVDPVTNAAFLDFVDAGGYGARDLWSEEGWAWVEQGTQTHPHFWRRDGDRWLWRGLNDDLDLPPSWPVWVTHAEAEAYARWRGRRLMTEAEYHRAAFGSPQGDRPFPWGDAPPGETDGNFDLRFGDPTPVGSFPGAASAWGVRDLVGNGWEWTASVFAPLSRFAPMPSYLQYSADFFDGAHYVMKGASPATPKELIRASFRNWFRPAYPWVWAKFRTVGIRG